MASQTEEWQRLFEVTQTAADIIPTPDAVQSQLIRFKEWTFSYATSGLNDESLAALSRYVTSMECVSQYESVLAGEVKNVSENNAVLHHSCRNPKSTLYQKLWADLKAFNDDLQGDLKTRFNTIVFVGIGGSYLGPQYLVHALQKAGVEAHRDVYFLPNLDPNSMADILAKVEYSKTLFVFTTKSGSTRETIENYKVISTYLSDQGVSEQDQKNQLVAITSTGSFFDDALRFSRVFEIDVAIGGRFSLSSAVGMVLLMACFGLDVCAQFLEGAHEMDVHAQSKDLRQNMPLMMAAIGFWQQSCKGFSARAIVPYSDALAFFPPFLQQLYCESLGKATLSDGSPLVAGTGPLIVGGVGTLLQHSLFQFFHDNPEGVPVQFIAFRQSNVQDSAGQQISLNQNCVAQISALIQRPIEQNAAPRPSTLLLADRITPRCLGSLLSLYENATMFEGFMYGINTFDQPAVELGKQLANRLKEGQSSDPLLDAFHSLFK